MSQPSAHLGIQNGIGSEYLMGAIINWEINYQVKKRDENDVKTSLLHYNTKSQKRCFNFKSTEIQNYKNLTFETSAPEYVIVYML